MLTWLVDLLFPSSCLGCGAFGVGICTACRQSFSLLTSTICPSCLKQTRDGKRHLDCGGPIDCLVSCWNYEGIVRKTIKSAKYQYYYIGLDQLAEIFVKQLPMAYQGDIQAFLATNPIVVPIPLHPKRYNQRGFNQSARIARYLAVYWHLSYSDRLIRRHRHTHPQADLNKQQRKLNISGAFSPTQPVQWLGANPLKGNPLLLVDDVWTTGVTMRQCAKVLKSLGGGPIWVLSLAR